jgi:HK97 family phage major capsid protein
MPLSTGQRELADAQHRLLGKFRGFDTNSRNYQMSKSLELRKQRAALVAEMNDLTTKTSFPAEAEARWNVIDGEQKALESQINKIEMSEKLAAEMRQFTPAPSTAQPGEVRTTDAVAEAAKTAEFEKRAFRKYVAEGRHAVTSDPELRTYVGLNVATGANGDFTVPQGFQKELEIKMKQFGGMLQRARILNTASGAPIQWPTMDDTANSGRWLSEAGAVSQTNPTFGQVNITSNLASSDQVLISIQLLQDTAFDMEGTLAEAFAIRLGRLLNLAYTSGTGSGQPQGILGVSGIGNVAAVGDPQTGNTATNSVGVDDLVNVQGAVDAAYRVGGSYMFNDTTFNKLRKLKNSLGQPLWEVSLTAAAPDQIMGKPYTVNYDMASPATTVKSVLFGDFSKYIVRNIGGVTVMRYNELYMPNHQIGFQAYLRTDGQCIQPAAFATLTNV